MRKRNRSANKRKRKDACEYTAGLTDDRNHVDPNPDYFFLITFFNHIPGSIFCIIKVDEDHKAPSNYH